MIRLAAAFIAIGASQIASANTPADYAYVFPIETTASDTTRSAWRIDLTPDVYRWLHDASLGDLEIFNAEQRPVPFARIAIEPLATSSERSVALPVLDLPATSASTNAGDLRLVIDRDADGRLRRIDAGEKAPVTSSTSRDWLVDASALDRAIDRLMLDWREPSAGVVARFEIEASDDLETWRSLGHATVLRLEQRGAKLERRNIDLGGAHAKYLRLHRLDDGSVLQGLAVEAHSVEQNRTMPDRAWLAADAMTASSDPAPAGISRFDYTLPAALPVDVARIELADDNALAPVTLLARNSDAPTTSWTRVGEITAFRLRPSDETLRNPDLDLHAAQRLREFRIESSTPIAHAPQLTLAYRPDRLVFLAEGAAPYTLAVGSLSARHADYPIEPALATLRASLGKDWQPPVAKLGAAQASGGAAMLATPPAPLPWRRWVLWIVLVVGALVIAGLALQLLRGAKPSE